MKKFMLSIFLLIVMFSFLSCMDEGPIQNPYTEDSQTVEDDKEPRVSSCKIVSNSSSDIFYINDQNNPILFTAYFYDQFGNEIECPAIWDYGLMPANTKITSDASSLSFDINSTQYLDDYTFTVKAKDDVKIQASYTVSLVSRNKLSNCISYSLMSSKSIDLSEKEEDLDVYAISELLEYDITNTRITNASKRMVINDSTDFNPTGSNVIFLNIKEGTCFGSLKAEVLQGEASIIETVDNGFLLCMAKDNQMVIVLLEAGTKDSRVLTFNVQVSSDHLLAKPVFASTGNCENFDGKYVDVTGDNVTNTLYPKECGYSLNITVERRAYNSVGDYFLYTDWKTNPCTADIDQGIRIHLLHAGEYRITANITDALSISDSVEKIIVVPPYIENNSNIIEVSSIECYEQIYTSFTWDNYENGSNSPRTNNYKVRINSLEQGVVNYSIVVNNSDSINYSKTITGSLYPGEEAFSTSICYAGVYKISAYVSEYHQGYGTLVKEEMDESNSVLCNLSITNCSETESLDFITVKEKKTEKQITIIATDDVAEDACVYVCVYRDFKASESFCLKPSEMVTIDNQDYDDVFFKSYIYFAGNKISSKVKYYSASKLFLDVDPQILCSDNEVTQNQRNARRVLVKNTQNDKGEYRKISYSWDGINWIYPESSLNNSGKLKEFEVYLDKSMLNENEDKLTIHVKSEPFNESAQGSCEKTRTVELTKLKKPKGSFSWSGLCNWRLEVVAEPSISDSTCIVSGYKTASIASKTILFNEWPGIPNKQTYYLMQWKYGYIDSDVYVLEVHP